ncbi:helix-turn-helix transcriptional regulator [Candidatus Ferrigenium straubiae]|jgi:predicted DNA-binding transcriptional regulator AlpA|uniref:helix-turn-helix transcriptional regulator n=1 Tax=Candidatus Ferrigenium straubiae TaxID=2919506 RepID=UPI003F4AD917
MRDYNLLERLTPLPDDILVGIEEVAALTGFAHVTIQQRRIKEFPNPLAGVRRLKWRLGDVRAWIRTRTQQHGNHTQKQKMGGKA